MSERVLLVAEAVTLAHIGRPLTLARVLESLGHDVVLACAPYAFRWVELENRTAQPIESRSPQSFLRALAAGRPLYDAALLKRYVEADLALIDRVKPTVVIGDFRLSLFISTRLRELPYGALANAYWSERHLRIEKAPDVALLNWMGSALADRVFRAAHRAAFGVHARPFIAACRHFGVAPPAQSLSAAYTASERTAFADVEEFYVGAKSADATESFVGPLHWSPPLRAPPDLDRWGVRRPLIYVSLGSSGSRDVAKRVVAALNPEDVDVVVTSAGGGLCSTSNAVVLDYANGDLL